MSAAPLARSRAVARSWGLRTPAGVSLAAQAFSSGKVRMTRAPERSRSPSMESTFCLAEAYSSYEAPARDAATNRIEITHHRRLTVSWTWGTVPELRGIAHTLRKKPHPERGW